MIGLSKVLVVDGLKSSRETLCSALAAHCDQLIEAEGVSEAHGILEAGDGFSLVLCAATLNDGDAADLLTDIATLSGTRPSVVVVAARPTEAEAKTVKELGAIAYLAKPISFLDLSRVLKRSQKALPKVAVRIHRKPLGTALLLDDAQGGDSRREVASHVLWDIHDVSLSGAFLETRGPVRPGRELNLGIVLDGQMIRVQARVIRLLEPSWDHVAGVGVVFLGFDEGGQEQLQAYIQANSRS